MSDIAQTHVGSGQVMTVLGPVAVGDLGPTLMHEHILNDVRCWWNEPTDPARNYLAHGPVEPAILGELRMDPFVNLDNCALDDEALAIEELRPVAATGGRTVVDPTCVGIGRDPAALARIATATGLNVVMGAGYYLQSSHPERLARMSARDVADEIVHDALEGVDGTGIKIGLIGEIGVSSEFTPDEEKSLRGAVQAQARTKLPLMVHLPGWFRLAHRVLDIVEEEGGDAAHTVLCHMNPSGADQSYQMKLAERGAFLEYDMIGMDFWYADQQVQSPSDDANAAAIKRLIDAGFARKILLSQDVFLKMMLSRYGGFGYAYVQRHFLPRLRRFGVTAEQCDALMVANPRDVFFAA